MERRLATILAADVVGYSRLMERDEAGTITALKSRRKEVLEPLVASHSGRIFKVAGDGVLIEFGSAVNAVQCAIELQQGMTSANASLTEVSRIVLRVGVNLGDVVIEGGDLYGDGVNIAARLESMAEPGGVLISGAAYDQVKNKIDTGFEDLGPQSLKNIAEQVRVYRIRLGGEKATTTRPVLALPDKPSLAVLPFTNMSGDPKQEYFADGITEDIITELSRFRSVFVIARYSSFQYRDRAVDVRRIGKELGVQYVVEGSVRKLDTRLRIAAQLIEATTGNHVWSERYDRTLADVFAVQDEVVQAIVARLAGQLAVFEAEKVRRKRTGHLGAYDCYLRGLDEWRSAGPESNIRSNKWFAKASGLDPDYAREWPLRPLSRPLTATRPTGSSLLWPWPPKPSLSISTTAGTTVHSAV
jgi:TolB-like protein/class 3 adenylate cyclase